MSSIHDELSDEDTWEQTKRPEDSVMRAYEKMLDDVDVLSATLKKSSSRSYASAEEEKAAYREALASTDAVPSFGQLDPSLQRLFSERETRQPDKIVRQIINYRSQIAYSLRLMEQRASQSPEAQ